MNTQVVLVSRPTEAVEKSNFKIVQEPIPTLTDGQVLVRNNYLSIDPAMRGWLQDRKSYIAPVAIGEVMRGSCVGEVVASKNEKFQVGDMVTGLFGWQEYFISDGKPLKKIIPGLDPKIFLGVLGVTGLSAYFGLLDIGQPKEGETVVVSGAAGAVGSVVGQIAKIKNCRVVGIAGSDDKCSWLVNTLGFDAAINYKTQNVNDELKKTCPKGVDVFFDNVGGEILDSVLAKINFRARVVICGAISQYNSAQPKGPSNYLSLLSNRARMEGFIIFDYQQRYGEGMKELGQWVAEKKIKYSEHIVDGLENAPETLQLLFKGENTGKLMIRIAKRSQL